MVVNAKGSRSHRDPAWVRRGARLIEPFLQRWFDPEVRGLSRLPQGPALLVSNHSGGFMTPDTWILCTAILRERGLGDVPHGLGHDQVLGAPLIGSVLQHLGGVRASHEEAHRIFEAGYKLLVYPGGDLDAFRPSHRKDEVVFGPRRGYVRLALRERVPVVPVVAAGAHEGWWVLTDGKRLAARLHTHRHLRTDVLPITLSIPWGLGPGFPYLPLPTRILVEVLPPVVFERDGPDAARDEAYVEQCHARVHQTMQTALGALAQERRALGRFAWSRRAGSPQTAPRGPRRTAQLVDRLIPYKIP